MVKVIFFTMMEIKCMKVILLMIKREVNGTRYYENGDYYIGEFKNDHRNGKGVEYYKNGNKKYEGDFFNSKYEGYGKYIYENGDYYIGEFKNGFFHGNGKEYSKDGNIKFEGEFIEGKNI